MTAGARTRRCRESRDRSVPSAPPPPARRRDVRPRTGGVIRRRSRCSRRGKARRGSGVARSRPTTNGRCRRAASAGRRRNARTPWRSLPASRPAAHRCSRWARSGGPAAVKRKAKFGAVPPEVSESSTGPLPRSVCRSHRREASDNYCGQSWRPQTTTKSGLGRARHGYGATACGRTWSRPPPR